MEFELSFEPINHDSSSYNSNQIGGFIDVYMPGDFPDLTEADVVLFGVPEYRGSIFNGSDKEVKQVRHEYYKLYRGVERLRIVDLGNLKIGKEKSDTFFLLSEVLQECHRRGLFALLIGGGQDATYAQYHSNAELKKLINLACIDSTFDLGLKSDDLNSKSYLSKIIQHEPNFLFNFSNIGYQSFLVPNDGVKLLNKLYFDEKRLGEVRSDISEVEPLLRNIDVLSLDISSIRLADAPGNFNGSPNGFSGDEICKIVRYAGLSDRISSFGIYEYDFASDINNQTAKLIAQIMWYFFEGYFNRIKRLKPNSKDFIKYHVTMLNGEYNTVFYKNKQLDKWWMEIPLIDNCEEQFKSHCFIPCSYKDYVIASNGDMPERWWRAFQKMN